MVIYNTADIIAELSPFASCVEGDDHQVRCHYCLKLGSSLERCSKCKVVRYCGRECQTKDWKAVHQSECKVFIRASSSEKCILISDTHNRLILRVILILEKYPEKEHEEIRTFNGPRSFSSLVGNGEKFFSSNNYSTKISIMRSVLENLMVAIEFSKLKDIFAKVTVNCADIYDDPDVVGGKGLYIGSSAFDHSCVPNSIYCPSVGINIKIRALKRFNTEIEAPAISYFDENLPLAIRRSALDMCMISCTCPRCLTPSPTLDLELMMKRFEFENAMTEKYSGSNAKARRDGLTS